MAISPAHNSPTPTLLGMSQTKIGEAAGLTIQQIQKYQRGSNRIGSSHLLGSIIQQRHRSSLRRCRGG
jgi:hypothetical protein